MDVYITIYRGDTALDEIEIEIHGCYHEDHDELEILKVVNTFNDEPIELTAEELYQVHTTEMDEVLEMSFNARLIDLAEERRHYRFLGLNKKPVTKVEVEEYETTSEKIVRAQCESIAPKVLR